MKKQKKVVIFSIVALILAIIATTVGVILMKSKKNETISGINPEIARSMEYEQVQPGDEDISGTDYVKFDAFFLRDLNNDGYAESIRGTCREIGESDTLYMDINVQSNGYLENGRITINSQNMYFSTAIVEDDVVSGNYISNNTSTINLKTINNGTEKLFYGNVNSGNGTTSGKALAIGNDTNNYSKVNSVTLTGTHVSNTGVRTPISKTVEFNVDWHGSVTARAYVSSSNLSQSGNLDSVLDETNGKINLQLKLYSQETAEELILKQAYMEGTIPALNGYMPTEVKITGTGINSTYNEETGAFTITRDATLNSSGIVQNAIPRQNTFTVNITYPYVAYEELGTDTISIEIPVKAYYEGYNNDSEEFENPIKSNTASAIYSAIWQRAAGTVAKFDVYLGKYRSYDREYVISKEEALKKYNGTAEETNDVYTVEWRASSGNTQKISSLIMKENTSNYSDRFLNTSGQYFNMSSYTKNIGIYFSNPNSMLGANGWIKVYDDVTGELLETFTSENWGTYNANNPYMFKTPVEHIRVETSSAFESRYLYVYCIKQIDDNVLTETFSREEFDNLSRIYSYLQGSIIQEGNNTQTIINTDLENAIYEAPVSVANISLSRNTLGTQTVEEDVNLVISTNASYYNYRGWKNGEFLIRLPEEILDVEINSVTASKESVDILAYEVLEMDAVQFIKLSTENENAEDYSIEISTNMAADPRSVNATKSVALYAYNEECNNYRSSTNDIYDINGDGITSDKVNYATVTMNIVAPSSLLTNQQAINYNEAGDSVVAPQIAVVDKNEADTATIVGSIANNYSDTISEVKILGKIPFEGNKFSLNQTELGSTYSTQMTSEGITLSSGISSVAKVYYSENSEPTNDVSLSSNGWKTKEEVTDWSKIKTYLIDLSDYTLSVRQTETFSYTVSVPSTVSYNEVAYSTHAVYFCLDTEQGKYRTQTETTKLGISIERKFNLNIQKTKMYTDIAVQGARFSVTADGENTSRIVVTKQDGSIEIENLYVEKTYTLKEIRIPSAYEKKNIETKFKVVVQDDELVLQIISGGENLKSSSIVQATTEERGQINFEIENKAKYSLILTKKDVETSSPIQGIRFRLTGKDLGEGITLTTNKEGKLSATGLYSEETYTLQEISADGYYVNETPIEFMLSNDNGNLSFNVISGSFSSTPQVVLGTDISGEGAQDTVTAELTNEKIPTYSISLTKYAEKEGTILKGVQFKIVGEGLDENGEFYTVGQDGSLTIDGLYEYVNGKNITGVYTITEITPPEGYALSSEELQFKAERNTSGDLEVQILKDGLLRALEGAGQDVEVENASSENAKINFGLENKPLFKLTKIDGTTRSPIPNTKFVLKEINTDLEEIGNAKDVNGNEVGEVVEGIDGRVVSTDENGNISYGLQTSLYKAVEVESAEGYVLPENEEDRTYYFGIGETKAQETVFGVVYGNTISSDYWNKIETSVETNDGGAIVAGFYYNQADVNNDGINELGTVSINMAADDSARFRINN